jgi:hypothetical protein
MTGGVLVDLPADSKKGQKRFLDYSNNKWRIVVTNQPSERNRLFKSFFTDAFPYTAAGGFRKDPLHYVYYDVATKNMRVGKEDVATDWRYRIPIYKKDYDQYFKKDIETPKDRFSEVQVKPTVGTR